VAEAQPLYAANMAHYDVIKAIEKCDLDVLGHHKEAILNLSSSISSSISTSFTSSSSSSSPSSLFSSTLLVPSLLLSIIQKETQDFLTEIEKSDTDIENRKNTSHGIASTPGKVSGVNGSKLSGSPIKPEIPLLLKSSGEHSSPLTKKVLFKSSQESQNSNNSPNNSNISEIGGRTYSSPMEKNIINISDKKEGNKSVEEIEKGEKEGKGEKGEKAEKGEKIPVAELILASHASLLLHALCVCLPEKPESNDVRTATKNVLIESDKQCKKGMNEFSPLKIQKYDHSVRNDDNKRASSTSTSVDLSIDLKKDRDRGENPCKDMSAVQVPCKISRSCVRQCLPKGTWWLPIRVLKGFLVLQGQVPYSVLCVMCDV
jgi:hypothetical protein